MKVSIYDVAKAAGVSVVTVSRVINGAPTVRRTSQSKVMAAIEALDYRPSAAARSLAKGSTNVIGMLVPDLSDPFLMEVVKTVDKALEEEGYFIALSVIDSNEAEAVEKSNFLFQEDRVDGVILLTPLNEAAYVDVLKKKKIPFVIVDNQLYPYTVSSVVVDNFKGGYEAGKLLIDTGHSKIAHVGGPEEILSANDRCKGFEKALEEMGLQPWRINRGPFSVTTGSAFIEHCIEEGDLPDAIFAADDHIAFGIIDALRSNGVSIPETVSVVGYDDHPFSSSLKPHLTTFKQPAEALGAKAVEILMNTIKGQVKRPIVVKMEPELILRETVNLRFKSFGDHHI